MTGALFGPKTSAAQQELEEDMAVLGIDPASLPAPPPEEDGVWPQNVAAVSAFLTVCRQWRTMAVGLGGVRYLGLDYAAAKAGLDLAGVAVTPELWAEVRVIETGAVAAFNEG